MIFVDVGETPPTVLAFSCRHHNLVYNMYLVQVFVLAKSRFDLRYVMILSVPPKMIGPSSINDILAPAKLKFPAI